MSKIRIGRFGVAATCAVLMACSGEVEPSDNAVTAGDSRAAAMEAKIEDLADGQRDAVFLRAIRDAQHECQHVQRSERTGEHGGLPLWRAWCDGGSTYTIVITRAGTAQVLDDAEVRLGHEAPPKDGGRGQ